MMHISFVMDGNGRWAKKRETQGVRPQAGAKTLVAVMNALGKFGIEGDFLCLFHLKIGMSLQMRWRAGSLRVLKTQDKGGARISQNHQMIGSRKDCLKRVLVLIDDAGSDCEKHWYYRYCLRLQDGDCRRPVERLRRKREGDVFL